MTLAKFLQLVRQNMKLRWWAVSTSDHKNQTIFIINLSLTFKRPKISKHVDSDEGAHYELPHLDLCCLQIQLISFLALKGLNIEI